MQGDVSSPASAPPSTAVEPRPLPNHPQAQDVQTGDDVASHPTPTLEKSAATPVVGPPLNPPSELPVKTHAAVQTVNEPPQNPPAVKTSGKRKSLALLTKQAANPAPVSTKPGGKTSYVVSESGGLAWEIQTEPPGFAGEPKLDGDRSNTAKGIETGPGKNPEEMTSAEEPAKEGQKDGQAGGGKRSDVGRKRRWSASLAPVLEELEEGEIRPEAQEEQEFGEGHTARLTAAAGAMQTEVS